MQQFDRLACYDSHSIGQEFSPSANSLCTERRRLDARRTELRLQEFQDSMSSNPRPPKSSMLNTCKFETNQLYCQSVITWVVTIVLSLTAGTICALVIKHLNM